MSWLRWVLLGTLLAACRAAAQCPPAPEPGWCERAQAGADGVLGTADDRPDCAVGSRTSCSDHAARRWAFNDAAACTDCARTLFAQVAAGDGFWLYFDADQLNGTPLGAVPPSLRVQAVSVATGTNLVLTAENECSERATRVGPVPESVPPGPFLYCDDCASTGRFVPRDAGVRLTSDEEMLGQSCDVYSATGGVRTAPTVPCLAWRATGTDIAWGPPIDGDADGDLDEDDDGVVDALTSPPCTPCPAPTCPCAASSDENPALGGQSIRVFVPVPHVEPRVVRIEMLGGGGRWSVMGSCEMPYEVPAFGWSPSLTLYDSCAAAVAARDASPALPLLSFPASPTPGIEVIDTSACPALITVSVTVCNSGAMPASPVQVSLSFDPYGSPWADLDLTAHPTDPACQGPFAPGECRTCEFDVAPPPGGPVLATVDGRRLVGEADEASPLVGCAPGSDGAYFDACGSWCVPVPGGSIAPATACLGSTVTIDALASQIPGCWSSLEYLLESPLGTPVPPATWTTFPRWSVVPGGGPHDYWVRFRCAALTSCEGVTGPLHADIDPPPPFSSPLAATPEGDCGIRLSWSPAAAGVTYDVHRADSSPVLLDAAHRIASGLTTTDYLDVAGSEGPFFYRVSALVAGCGPVPNAGGEATASPAPVAMPGGVVVASEGECALRVTWDPAVTSAGVTYDVYRDTGSPVPLDAAHRIASGLTATTLLDAPPWGAPVRYRVEAVNACHRVADALGDSAPASSVDLTPPSFAGIVNTRDLGGCRVEVTWGAASDSCSGIAGFNVYRDHGVAHAGETLVASLVPASPYVDTTPGNGTWVYVVRAVDAAGHEETNDVFQQESEGSCTNDFPRDAGMDGDDGIDSPNADGGHLRLRRDALGEGLRIRWKPSPDEGVLYPVTYEVQRGDLRSLRADGYSHALIAPDACGLQVHEYLALGQDDGVPAYYLVICVSGDNLTAGYDSSGRRIPARGSCP